jgi:hypothetical protein
MAKIRQNAGNYPRPKLLAPHPRFGRLSLGGFLVTVEERERERERESEKGKWKTVPRCSLQSALDQEQYVRRLVLEPISDSLEPVPPYSRESTPAQARSSALALLNS